VVGVVVAACSGAPAPEGAESCEELVEVGVDWVERTAVALEGQPLEVVTGDAAAPEELAELQAIGVAIDVRAAELECSTEELNQAIATEVADLESDDPVVSLFLRIVQSNAAEASN
jgi:hypothetical protein